MLMRRSGAVTKLLAGGALVAALVLSGSTSYAQRGNPFAMMRGSWSGGGTIALSNGTKERIRCRASYVPDGDASLALELRCASDSYKFELQSNVSHNGGTLSGSWSEATRGAGGSISGTVHGGRIQATASGPTFTAALALNTQGNRQTVSILSPGSELSAVSISLSRGH
jgi:hypothetical protein